MKKSLIKVEDLESFVIFDKYLTQLHNVCQIVAVLLYSVLKGDVYWKVINSTFKVNVFFENNIVSEQNFYQFLQKRNM